MVQPSILSAGLSPVQQPYDRVKSVPTISVFSNAEYKAACTAYVL